MSLAQQESSLALSERDAMILDFEDEWYLAGSSKEVEVLDRFGLTNARYYQILNALIDTQAALEYRPLLVKRLRRLREQRQRARSAQRLAN